MKVILEIDEHKSKESLKVLRELSFVKDLKLVDFQSNTSYSNNLSDIMIASEPILSKDWMKKEEEDVWADL